MYGPKQNTIQRFLDENKASGPLEVTKEQVNNRNDYFERYGKDINALSKIVTRISKLEKNIKPRKKLYKIYWADGTFVGEYWA